VVNIVHRLGKESGQSGRQLLTAVGLARSSFLRWQQRMRRGLPAIGRAGTRDVLSLEQRSPGMVAMIRHKIATLSHASHRSQGAPGLYREVRAFLSRRSFYILVHEHRQERLRQQQAALTRITWSQPAAVWAMDPGQLAGRCWNLISDLASRFRFALKASLDLPARSIADQLVHLFHQHGPPLVLKRDNGSNLVSGEVEDVLDAFGVIALNSPLHYPGYNGAIEYAQRELKARVSQLTRCGLSLDAALAASPSLLNAHPRPCLDGLSAAQVFHPARHHVRTQFTLQRRKEIKNSIAHHAEAIRDRMKTCGHHAHDAAWRRAVEQWLVDNGMLTVRQPQTVSPHFP
jgi:hypothetical protein